MSSKVPSKEPSPEALCTEPLQREMLHSYSPLIHLSKSLVVKPPSRFPSGAMTERDAHLQGLFFLSSRVLSKEALPPGSLHRAPMERDAPPPEPLSAISQSPQ